MELSGLEPPAGTFTAVVWNFGDGQTSFDTSAFVSHSYASSNTYPVTLAVTNTYGFGNITFAQNVLVTNVPSVAIQGNPRITRIQVVGGTNILLAGTNDARAGGRFYNVIWSANLASARTNWLAATNGSFAPDGGFTNTILGGVSGAQQFFLLQVP